MKIRSFSIVIVISLFLAIFVSSCNTPNEEMPTVLILLAGKHANSQSFDVQLDSVVQNVYSTFGNIGIIVIDGEPSLLYNENTKEISGCYSIDILEKSKKEFNLNENTWRMRYLKPQLTAFQEIYRKSIADDPEVDTLKALQLAVEAFNTIEASMGIEVKKEIIILDTGLCTSGALNFLQPDCLSLLMNEKKLSKDKSKNNEVSQFIDFLDEEAEIPDLSNITITWYGLGKTNYPQPNLTNLNVQNLRYLWGEILKRSGAVPSYKEGTDSEYGIFIAISTSDSIICDQTVTPVINWINNSEENIPKLTEEMLGFEPNSCKFQIEKQADEILQPYAKNLMNYPDMKILLIGTTSSWGGGSISLSEERAQKVQEKLIDFGVPENRINIVGLGYDLDFCKDDTPNGIFVEEIAKENRAVFILPCDSERAHNILTNSNFEVK